MGFKGILTVVNMVFSGHSMIQSSGSTSGWLIPEEKHAHSEVPNMIKPWFLGGSSVKKPWLMCETWWTINIGIQENIQPMSRGKWIIGNSGSLPNDGLVDLLGVVSHQGPTIANLHHLLWNRELALYLHDERKKHDDQPQWTIEIWRSSLREVSQRGNWKSTIFQMNFPSRPPFREWILHCRTE